VSFVTDVSSMMNMKRVSKQMLSNVFVENELGPLHREYQEDPPSSLY
jgi:hypothetical protein